MNFAGVGDYLKNNGLGLIGGLLTNPVGTVVNQVAMLVGKKLDVEPTPEAIQKKLETDPDSIIKLRELQYKHEAELGELAIKSQSLNNAEMANARSREIDILSASKGPDGKIALAGTIAVFMPSVLSLVVVCGFFAVIAAIIHYPMESGDKDVLFLLLGTLASAFGAVLSYYFGTTSGSREKDKTLAGVIKNGG